MKVIAVSGTPGTGKTTIAKKLAKQKGYQYVDVKQLIKDAKIADSYDRKMKCYVVDTKKLNRLLIWLIGEAKKSGIKGLVLDSHLSHYLPAKYVDKCIITKCDISVLNKRLKKRGYSHAKIRENLDSEIFDICLEESKRSGHRIDIIYTSKHP